MRVEKYDHYIKLYPDDENGYIIDNNDDRMIAKALVISAKNNSADNYHEITEQEANTIRERQRLEYEKELAKEMMNK